MKNKGTKKKPDKQMGNDNMKIGANKKRK